MDETLSGVITLKGLVYRFIWNKIIQNSILLKKNFIFVIRLINGDYATTRYC